MWRKILCVCCFVLAAANIAFIFLLSSESPTVSNSRSVSLTEGFLHTVDPSREDFGSLSEDSILSFFHHYIRKFAHFAEYASLGFLTCMGFQCTAVKKIMKPFIPGVISVITAMADEIYQTTIPGRAAMVTDVLTDTGGAVFGILLACLIAAAAVRIARRHEMKKSPGYRAAPKDNLPPL